MAANFSYFSVTHIPFPLNKLLSSFEEIKLGKLNYAERYGLHNCTEAYKTFSYYIKIRFLKKI